MQFPREPDAAPGVTEDVYDLRFRSPVVPARRVGERNLVPLIVPRAGSGNPGKSAAQTAEHQRSGEERRKFCRRIFGRTIVLDTRSKAERRGGERREGEATFNVDVRV